MPFDVAVTKHYDKCAELLRPDAEPTDNGADNSTSNTPEKQTESSDEPASGETDKENTTDDSQQTKDTDDKKTASEDNSSNSQEKPTTSDEDNADHQEDKDGDGKDSKDSEGNERSDAGDEDKDTGDSADNGQNSDSCKTPRANEGKITDCVSEQPEDSSSTAQRDDEADPDGKPAEEGRQDGQGDPTKEEGVKDLETEGTAKNKGGNRTPGGGQKTKDDVVGTAGDSDECSKRGTDKKPQSDKSAAKRTPESTENRNRSNGKPTSPSRSSGDSGRRKGSAPSRTAHDAAGGDQSNEQRKDRRRIPTEAQPASDQNKENNQRLSQNSASKDGRRAENPPTKSGSESPPSQSSRKDAPPSTMKEKVRIFDMRRLTSRELEKTRRYQLQLGRTGGPLAGSTDRQLTRLLTEDFNEKAYPGYVIDSGRVNDLDSLKTHLEGKISTIERQNGS